MAPISRLPRENGACEDLIGGGYDVMRFEKHKLGAYPKRPFQNDNPKNCHSEHSEESAFESIKSRLLAMLGMTGNFEMTSKFITNIEGRKTTRPFSLGEGLHA
jgi:hypothetical protein